ncbi:MULTISPECIES: aminotransferase class IV [unclassified Microbacterium]|uniref:aminotransferase class IV n=1 Tax=unclassified Microbacterium TaxID=2609290 RepID=UPI00214C1558|nr:MULTISPECIES: aminotransferase class IV [unclassified Microbacterium]MCR2810753.1 aminotransferase class IV [Microbacterium sp. zg.B185]WIM18287.1 aminotransferase class IV [Microbacterium sp. zg-B185]
MVSRYALIIDPASPDDPRADFTSTFAEVDPAAPALSVGELSTQRGDGIFESVGVVDGHAQEVQAHLDRLAHSAEICDLPVPNLEQWRAATALAAAHCGPGESVIKLILSRGVDHGPAPTAWITANPAPDFTAVRVRGVRVVTLERGYDSAVPARAPWLLLGAKTLSYAVNMAAIREAKRRGADDAIFVSTDGIVFEAPTASLILRVGDVYLTPAPSGGILHGTTQLSVFAWLEQQGLATQYRGIPTDELPQADAAWLVSSVRLAAPITEIDGAPIPLDAEFTARLNQYLLSPRD